MSDGNAYSREAVSIGQSISIDAIDRLSDAIDFLSDLTNRGGSCVIVLVDGSASQQLGRFDQAVNIDRYYRSFEHDTVFISDALKEGPSIGDSESHYM